MADLSFSQLAAQLPAGSILALEESDPVPAAGLYIRVDAVTGDPISALSDTGVIETLMKMFLASNRAQNAFNLTAPTGERLRAFLDPSFSSSSINAEGEATTRISCTLTAILDISVDSALSPTQ